jgi:ATP-dependent 26S proteasome regulatory subunit
MILRPSQRFDSDALTEVIRRWKRQAPSILVIEDLDWVLEKVNVSTFLNTLDGIESSVAGGMLLIATTNHPEKLDPAVNNRPGRFDVSIEVPSPDDALRLAFIERALPTFAGATARKLSDMLRGCAFAHLHELLRLSGLYAIHNDRAERNEADLISAAKEIAAALDQSATGFAAKLDVPFGLQHLHAMRTGKTADASD